MREDVDLLTGFIYSPNIIASAPLIEQAKVPTLIMNAATAWIPNLSPASCPCLHEHVADRLSRGRYAAGTARLRDCRGRLYRLPAGQGFARGIHDGVRAGGRSGGRRHPHGRAGQGARLHAVHAAGQGRAAGLLLRLRARRAAGAVFKTYADLGMREAGVPIGPGDITQDTELQGLGDVAIGVVTLGQYQADLEVGTNRDFVEAWRQVWPDSTPDFMAAAGYDGMAAIVDAIVEQNGEDRSRSHMEIWSGWTHESPRGHVMIDAETRDIVQDMQVNEVYAEDGRLKMRTIDVIPQVKDRARSRRSAAAPSMSCPSRPRMRKCRLAVWCGLGNGCGPATSESRLAPRRA